MSLAKVIFISSVGEVEPYVIPSLLRLREQGYRVVIVAGEEASRAAVDRYAELLRSQGVELDGVFAVPKPSFGALQPFLANTPLDRQRSIVVGREPGDAGLAQNLGLELTSVAWPALADRLGAQPRCARAERRTKETSIAAEVNLDGTGRCEIHTGIAYFDHMLEQIAKHAGFDCQLRAEGDLQVDEHHTVEDVAIVLGECLDRALGDRYGIGRFGFLLPMDETEAKVSLDLSGRPFCRFQGSFAREYVGELPTEMVPHFFRSFADAIRATLHIEVRGENTHHVVEACFKGLGRSLRGAIARADKAGMPSTKGSL